MTGFFKAGFAYVLKTCVPEGDDVLESGCTLLAEVLDSDLRAAVLDFEADELVSCARVGILGLPANRFACWDLLSKNDLELMLILTAPKKYSFPCLMLTDLETR